GMSQPPRVAGMSGTQEHRDRPGASCPGQPPDPAGSGPPESESVLGAAADGADTCGAIATAERPSDSSPTCCDHAFVELNKSCGRVPFLSLLRNLHTGSAGYFFSSRSHTSSMVNPLLSFPSWYHLFPSTFHLNVWAFPLIRSKSAPIPYSGVSSYTSPLSV